MLDFDWLSWWVLKIPGFEACYTHWDFILLIKILVFFLEQYIFSEILNMFVTNNHQANDLPKTRMAKEY